MQPLKPCLGLILISEPGALREYILNELVDLTYFNT